MGRTIEQLDKAVRERLAGMTKAQLQEVGQRAIDGRLRLSVPPSPADDDLILAALIDEVFALRPLGAAAARYEPIVEAAREVARFITLDRSGGIIIGGGNNFEQRQASVRALHGALDALALARATSDGEVRG